MKNLFYTLIIPLFFSLNLNALPIVVIVGSDGDGGDEFSFVLLKDFAAGEIIYFTEDEYSDSGDNFFSGEGHIEYTIPAGGLLEGDVVIITESSPNTFSVTGGGGSATHVAGSGTWGLSFQDEIYAYSASSASDPWDNVTEIHCFYWTAVIDPLNDQIISNDYPNAFYLEPNNYPGNPGNQNIDYKTGSFRVNTTISDLQNINNWNRASGNITLSPDDFITNMLPIELVSFDARLRKNQVVLDWVTASEINNERFEVEHGKDGKNFNVIGIEAGRGTSNEINSYQMIHATPHPGLNYYRLKQIDYDGAYSYSDVVVENYKGNGTMKSVYPNPFHQEITVTFSDSHESFLNEARTVQIYDVNGRLVLNTSIPTKNGVTTLDLSTLKSGVYFLKTQNDESTASMERIIKI
ncbi:MAG: T9SS type A sorting domain-containing protein [Saprospiraceae bacterium]|nr:T9SS type A sorting domain-containing protein [Saprospiraceae bacterium]